MKFPLHFEIIQLTSEYVIIVACSECGFFSKEGAGCKSKINAVNKLVNLFYFNK